MFAIVNVICDVIFGITWIATLGVFNYNAVVKARQDPESGYPPFFEDVTATTFGVAILTLSCLR